MQAIDVRTASQKFSGSENFKKLRWAINQEKDRLTEMLVDATDVNQMLRLQGEIRAIRRILNQTNQDQMDNDQGDRIPMITL